MCGSMVDIQSATAEIRWGKKKEERKKKERRNHRTKIYWPVLFHRAAIRRIIHRVSKTPHLCFAMALTHVNVFWYFFGRNVTDDVSNQKTLYCAPQITCTSALPGKTGKGENRIFHSNAVSVHCQIWLIWQWKSHFANLVANWLIVTVIQATACILRQF